MPPRLVKTVFFILSFLFFSLSVSHPLHVHVMMSGGTLNFCQSISYSRPTFPYITKGSFHVVRLLVTEHVMHTAEARVRQQDASDRAARVMAALALNLTKRDNCPAAPPSSNGESEQSGLGIRK